MRSYFREGEHSQHLCLKLFTLLAVALLCLPALAQTTGTLLGTVSDQSGAAVPKAKVVLLNENTGDVRDTLTNEVGRFTIAGVRPGTYTVKVASEKFKGWQRTGFVMNAADTRDISDIRLEVGSASESITVEAANALVDIVSNGERSALLDVKSIERLPLVGRNVTELFKTLPGVSAVATSNANNQGFDFSNAAPTGSPIGVGLSANGAPYRGGSMLLLDGANIIDIGCNCWSIAVPNPEFTQEVKVQTSNFGADQPNGPVVFATTSKSGGNKYHGTAYFSARNNALNSRTWAEARNTRPKEDRAWYYPGGTFGGPVPGTKGKVMFWGGYEYWWQKLGAGGLVTSWVPTASMRAGNFSLSQADNAAYCAGSSASERLTNSCAGLGGTVLPNGTALAPGTTQLPSSAIDPTMVRMMNAYFPEPNANTADYNWYLPVTAQQNGYVWRTRVDYNISESTKLFVSYQRAHNKSFSPTHIWWNPSYSVLYPGGGINNPADPKTYSANFLHVFSPTLTNEMVITYAKLNAPFTPNNLSAVSKATNQWGYRNVWNNGNNDPLMPGLYSGGARTLPEMSQPDLFSNGGEYPMLKATPTFANNVSKVYKNHTFKGGFYYAMPLNHQAGFNTPNGVFRFGSIDTAAQNTRNVVNGNFYGSQNPMANFLMGIASGTTGNPGYTEDNQLPVADQVYRIYSFYGMDDWKVNRRLTLNLGMRFDHIGRWYERTGTGMAVWLPGLYDDDLAAQRTNPGLRWHGIDSGIPISGTQATVLNVSPRIGLSWDVFGNGKTVVRGGWGMYRYNDEPAYGGALSSAQMLRTYNLPAGSILVSQIGPSLVNTARGGTSNQVTAADPNDHRVPTTRTWNLTISRQLPWRTLLEVAYVGNSTTNLLLGGQTAATALGGNDLINVNKIPLGGLFGADPVTGAARPADLEATATTGNWQYQHYFPLWQGYGTNRVSVLNHAGYANYNGLQIAWAKTQGAFTFNANFTWSKALGIVNSTVDAFNVDNNYGILSIDRPRVLTLTYAYDIGNRYKGFKVLEGALNGWTIAGLTTVQSGGNLQASYSTQNLGLSLNQSNGTTGISTLTMYGTNVGSILPVYTCDPNKGVSGTAYINLSCVSAPALPAAGTLAQYGQRQAPYLAGPAYFNQDLSLRKSFKISERQSVQVGFNANNFFNHANWYPTMGTLKLVRSGNGWAESGSSANYGRSVNKDGQRVLMFTAKYSF